MIRRAGLPDVDGLIRLEELCFDRGRFRPDHLRWVISSERTLAFVEDDGAGLSGTLMLQFEGRVCQVMSVAVVPAGRRKGLGTRFMRLAEDIARERGCASMRLEVSTRNLAAIELYRGLDYRLNGHLPRYYSWGEDAFSMVKPLRETAPPASVIRDTVIEHSLS